MTNPTKNPPQENKFTRFWSKVEVKGDDDCWRWKGTIIRNGYGQVGQGGKILYAHRVSYELSKGKIPAGMYVCHSCDNKWCVNPSHLWIGTAKDNMRDASKKGLLPIRLGENAPNVKMTEEAVIALRKGEATTGEIAKKYGVDTDTAWCAKVGKSWRHVNCTTRAKNREVSV